MKPIEDKYSPLEIEKNILDFWEENDFFKASETNNSKPSFCIILPPPNVTGRVHIGHALNGSLQDVLIRWKRMSGFNALWLPGTDHAGIATQARVEKDLAEKGLTKKELGREKFVEKIWEWKNKYGDYILTQLRTLGFSCDWTKHTFTLDENVSRAVKKVFVELYNKKRIYKDFKLINWSTSLESAISDLEVEYKEVQGSLWHISYPLVGAQPQDALKEIIVATTRPETLLGDVAVAVHPEDKRYKDVIGKKLLLPFVNREIPIISDSHVDSEFGSGAVKITPAHDFNDYEMGRRHHLEPINILTEQGTLNEKSGPYQGLSVKQARKKIVEDLKNTQQLIKEVPHTHSVGHCTRSGCVIEPFLSEQWFLKMEELSGPAKRVVHSGTVSFQPESWVKTYLHWMDNIQDWCISRQLWWGHQIPCWNCEDCEHLNVSEDEVIKCEACGSEKLKREEDVLDTWFSSALWPFSTLGWPEENTKLQEKFYPTDVLITGPDIIFFWVARMIMMSLEFKKEVPFRKVFLHGIVRDHQGRKMSKSLDNSIDPLDVASEFGADALRFTLLSQAITKDTRFSLQNVEKSRNFMNKLWNASRLTFSLLENFEVKALSQNLKHENFQDFDHWILKKLSQTQEKVDTHLDNHNFHEAHHEIYHFFWNEFCDWYLEIIKPYFYSQEKPEFTESHKVLFQVLESILKLLHPFIPFITEELFQRIHGMKNQESISHAVFPKGVLEFDNKKALNIEKLVEVVSKIRNFRAENKIALNQKITAYLSDEKGSPALSTKNMFDDMSSQMIQKLSGLKELCFGTQGLDLKTASRVLLSEGMFLFFDLREGVDKEKENSRLTKIVSKLDKEIAQLEQRLQNPSFSEKAPASVVEKAQNELETLEKHRLEAHENLKKLSSLV